MEQINLKAARGHVSDNGNICAPDPFRGQPVYMYDRLFVDLYGVEVSDEDLKRIHSLMNAEIFAMFKVELPNIDREIIGRPITIESSCDGWHRLKFLIKSD